MRRALLAVVCLTACSPSFDGGSAVILCASDAECPEGLTCVGGGRCLRDEAIDREGSRQIAPETDARVAANTAIAFVWTPVTGASRYWLTIATDPDFSDLVAESPRELTAPTDEVRLPAGTYWWRAVSDVSADTNRVAPRRLAVLDNVIYVFCAADDTCEQSPDIAELGTVAFPYRSIQRAVDARSGAAQIRVATRAPAYRETVKIVGGGFELMGGFSSDFTERSGHTSISADGPVFDAVDVLAATTVTGFDFIRMSGLAPVTTITLGSRFLVFDDCAWSDVPGGGSLVAITSSTGTIIRNSVLTRSDGLGPAVHAFNGGALQLEDVVINASGEQTGAIRVVSASSLEARRITVTVNAPQTAVKHSACRSAKTRTQESVITS